MSKEIRIMKDVNDLILNPNNLKNHDERSINEKMETLSTFNQQEPIVIDSNNIVLAGNGRLIAARKLGWKEIWVTVSELKESKAIAYSIADNKVAESSTWKYESLGNSLTNIINSDPKLSLGAMGFQEYEYQPLINFSSKSVLTSTQGEGLSEDLLTTVFGKKDKKEKKSSDSESTSPLSTNSYNSPKKKEKSIKEKRSDLENIDQGSKSTTLLVTEAQNKTIQQTIDLVRSITQDKTLTTGECLEIICKNYIDFNNDEEGEEKYSDNEYLETF